MIEKNELKAVPNHMVERLFPENKRFSFRHKKFISEMLIGIIGSRSPIIANIARFLDEEIPLKQTEKRLCRLLKSSFVPWDDLRQSMLWKAAAIVKKDDIIAFDPGDIIKNYARKMESLYKVHDGDKDACALGYEEFSVEAIQWINGKKTHIPLWQAISNAGRDEYISQNFQINYHINEVATALKGKGIWTFDRGHDRSRILEDGIFLLSARWILRSMENRVVIFNKNKIALNKLIEQMQSRTIARQIVFPKKTGLIFLAWRKISLIINNKTKEVYFLTAHDKRNEKPVAIYTNIEIDSADKAIIVFGYYLERWGKEEGYRFTKSFLNLENLRPLSYAAIQNLAFLIYLAYYFITQFYRNNPDIIESLCEQKLKNFKNIKDIKYKYYRIGQLLRMELCNILGKDVKTLMLTETR